MYLARGTQGCYLLQQDPGVAKSVERKGEKFVKNMRYKHNEKYIISQDLILPSALIIENQQAIDSLIRRNF